MSRACNDLATVASEAGSWTATRPTSTRADRAVRSSRTGTLRSSRWLERRGYQVSYCTDYDLHEDENLLGGEALLVSAGHDEYWSAQMRRRLLEFVDRGGNVCFFAGDVACFEVHFAASGERSVLPEDGRQFA